MAHLKTADLGTPSLVVDTGAFEHNLATMTQALPGRRLRPHVKAHKSTAIARRQAGAGHPGFTCATPHELEGMAAAGFGDDLLLANECVDVARLDRLGLLAQSGRARITVAIDSEETVVAASRAGITEVLVDVDVGLPRCGCDPNDAGRLADLARMQGMTVRGVMGYEGHAVGVDDRTNREAMTSESMALLATAHDAVGGEIVSAGGTGTFDINTFATEIQAGSYILMDTAYGKLGLPFRQALFVVATVVSVSSKGWAVCDAGLKALGMDHGNPSMNGFDVWFCSDEHTTFSLAQDSVRSQPRVGDRVLIAPAHVDPTVAYHETMYLADGGGDDDLLGAEILDEWAVDLRGW